MHTQTILSVLAFAGASLAAAIGTRSSAETPTRYFIARALSVNTAFTDHPLGIYHPADRASIYEGIADLWGSAQGQLLAQDYVYLAGSDSESQYLTWNRTQSLSLYFGDENKPLYVNETSTADASKQVTGLSIGVADQLIHIKDDAFSFTACVNPDNTINVSYILEGNTPASSCTAIQLRVAESITA